MLHLVLRVEILVKTTTFQMLGDNEGHQTKESVVSMYLFS